MKNIYLIFRELFYALTAALIIFVVLELVWPNMILAYININWVLILWLIDGIVVLMMKGEKNKK